MEYYYVQLIELKKNDKSPRKKRIFLLENVIYSNPYDKDDPNNEITATVIKVYEPESYEQKFSEEEKKF